MILNKYITSIKEFFLRCISVINLQRLIFYTVFFICYFFLYFTITIPQILKDSDKNPLIDFVNSAKNDKIGIMVLLLFDALFIIAYVYLIVYYYNNKNTINLKSEFTIIISLIISSTLLTFFNVLVYGKELKFISDWKWTESIFIITSTIFYILFVILFLYNIESEFNVEFFVSLIVLIIYFSEYILISTTGLNQLYERLLHDNFSTMTINCFANMKEEDTIHPINTKGQQLIDIQREYGPNYLKTIGNIPISFINSKTNEYQDLILADFYYPGSFYSYLADSPTNGTPNLDALRITLANYNARFIHLDIFSSNINDPFDTKAEPVIRCNEMNVNASPLSIIDTFSLINKWAWINTDSNNNICYPLFLYLNFNFDESNESLYLKIYDYLIKFFSKYFVDKKYSFCGRNSSFLISMAKIKECLGKIIIVTNRYPTKCALDELINASASLGNTNKSSNNCINLREYKESYIIYDNLGLSQDQDKTVILNNSRTNITFYYTLPNVLYKTNAQRKSGLYNASFQDCAQYGIQGTLMYMFLPDDNLNKWNAFFKNKNNLNPVLKHESLRYIINTNITQVKQNPIIGLQTPQKYTLIPGLLTTEKSNLSDSVTNVSNI